MGVSKNNGTPKSSILRVIFIIKHPFWGYPLFLETPIYCLLGDYISPTTTYFPEPIETAIDLLRPTRSDFR